MEQQYRTRLPGWEILEPPIGTGGFSTVYEIVRVDKFGMEEHAALKVISVPENKSDIEAFRDDGLDDKSITAYFKTQVDDISREFLLLSDMKGNSHIVSYEDHQIVQHDHDPGWDILIRMELLASLTDYYRANFAGTAIDETTVIKIGVDLCRALELCERKKIIHRDIKPQNIFVNRNGDFKLGDFGIARVSDHTTRATKAGTYTYMAPEVYQNRGYNAKVDQYSLGLVLYWLLNERRMPFAPPDVPTAESNSIALQRRMSGEPLPAPLHGSPELKRIVLRACAFDPNERFSSPMELRLALELIAHGGLEHWRPGVVPAGLGRSRRQARQPEQQSGATVGKYTCSRQAEETTQSFYSRAETVGKDEPYRQLRRPKKKKKRWLIPAVCGAAVLVIAAGCILGILLYRQALQTKTVDPAIPPEPAPIPEEPNPLPEEPVVLESISMSEQALTLFVGREAQLSLSAVPEEYPLDGSVWSSSDPAVAEVDESGLVAAKRAGETEITAEKDGKSAVCRVTVKEQEITRITLDSSGAKTEYFVGEAFDETGLTALIQYNTGDEETVSSGFTGKLDSSSAGSTAVTVYYGGELAGSYSVTVKNAEVSSIRIVTLPTTALTEGESLSLNGLEIEVTYTDGSVKNVHAGDSALSCSPTTFSSTGEQTVTVSYGGKTASFSVQIAPADRYVVSLSSSNISYGAVLGGGTFKKGETATLEVVPSEGCQFDAWSDGSTQTRRTIKVEENISLTAYFYGPLVDYTPEDEIPQNAVKVGDAKKQYQYQKKEYTSSDKKSMDGWTFDRRESRTTEWTEYSASSVTAFENDRQKREVRTQEKTLYKTQYHYYRYYGETSNDAPWTFAGGNHPYYEDRWTDYELPWLRKSGGMDQYGDGFTGNGKNQYWLICDGSTYGGPGPWTREVEAGTQTLYSYRDIYYTYYFYRYSEPYWSDSQVSSDDVKLVSTRLLYRYRLR